MNQITIRCPHCGKELTVPEHAGKIVCMYCAGPIDTENLQPPEKTDASGGVEKTANGEEYAVLAGAMEQALTDELFTKQLRTETFNRANYQSEFENYRAVFRPALSAFRLAALADEEQAVQDLGRFLFRRFSEEYGRQNGVFDHHSLDCRFTATSLTIPSLLEEGFPPAEAAVDVFLAEWKKKYPRQPLGKASYDKIVTGFKKRLCYITTATCTHLGAGDDCPVLESFRSFRDGWLASAPGGKEKIDEYYLFAPLIVEAIDSSSIPEKEYHRIWSHYLSPCLEDLRDGKMESCAGRYERMVRSLEEKWLS